MYPYLTLIILGMAASMIAIIITEANVFKSFRAWIRTKNQWLSRLLHCPFCTSVWVCFGLTAWYKPTILPSSLGIVDWFVTSMIMVFIASLCSGITLRLFTFKEEDTVA